MGVEEGGWGVGGGGGFGGTSTLASGYFFVYYSVSFLCSMLSVIVLSCQCHVDPGIISMHVVRLTYLMFYAQSIAKGHIKAKQNVFLPQVKF